MELAERSEVLVVGSGAGGAVTALELARAGFDVQVVEDGERHPIEHYGGPPTRAMRMLYRRRGMMPILGRVPIGYVEGRCLGGSTEINSGFWQRVSPAILSEWKAQMDLADAGEAELAPHFEWAEQQLGVSRSERPWPASTRVLARGLDALGWAYEEVARAAPGCRHTNTCAQGCPTGAKQGMSRSLLPQAEAAGARIATGVRVQLLLRDRERVSGVVARVAGEDGVDRLVKLEADHVFVCAGPTETPALLQRSGVRSHVGNSLRVHPYLKVAALYDEEIRAEDAVLPLVQVKEFAPDTAIGGAYFTAGHLAMTLSENGPGWREYMGRHRHFAQYYVGVKGGGKGSVRPSLLSADATLIRYDVSRDDLRGLGVGLARLAQALLAGGARAVIPSVHGLPAITREAEATRWLDERLPSAGLSLVTVHAFSSCPMGERRDRCAVDSHGRSHDARNLFLNDASVLPDSPGVNPQATVMAFARRNALRFAAVYGARRST